MILRPTRFWGHPDNWSEEAWREYLSIMHGKGLLNLLKRIAWNIHA